MIGLSSCFSALHGSNITAMKNSFYLKKSYRNKNGKHPLYLNLYIHRQRKRIPVDIFLLPTEWSQDKQCVLKSCPNGGDYNLILKEILARINKIEIQYRLTGEVLTVEKCTELLKQPELLIDFIAFMENEILLKTMEPGTVRNHNAVLAKLREYRSQIHFSDVNDKLILEYRKYLQKKLQNGAATIDSNIKIIKHYIRIAKKRGLIVNIDLENIKIRQHRSHRTNLTLEEVDRMKEYYFSGFISDSHRLILGYFLFNCMTGQRINDMLEMKRADLEEQYFNFWNKKSKKQQLLKLIDTARRILNNEPRLFTVHITPEYINREIKQIASFLKIRKHLVCHVARHTFATNYLRVGGKVEDLQVLLGHADIKTTMIYVHIVEGEVVNSMSLLD